MAAASSRSRPRSPKAGCRTFFVANLAEARRARAVAPDATIYVLNGLLPGTAPAYAQANPSPGDRQPAPNSTSGTRFARHPDGAAAPRCMSTPA